ncbi:prepilin-type N-terminal cleavage/methylation domain-containing protein [Tumebacillus permanentifrigoris]|uniref:Prepilin-type N-terminal cleavage/methylation domain-containing protein n=1 Tax=Tumebacillus permanentifrigoris TaxID=378543 RepID=A0A316D612_9BACL|nr:prepilin-type N-terminal cleavage/methylation domain-containing protein [Tumebacillus permanentifrigoris]PWK06286.1 prepilin-type N-terminal cleavage/methylation domain-containing protein [Tumebacillus permanentifrigoris]
MSNVGRLYLMRRNLNKEQGLTLLELLIALTIWALLLPVIAGGLLFTVQSYTRASERLEAREQALAVLRKVEGEVRDGHSFKVQSNGVSFLDVHDRLVQYQLTRTGLLQRVEEGVGNTVIGAKLTVCRWALDASPPLLHLQLTTQVGRATVELEEQLAVPQVSP